MIATVRTNQLSRRPLAFDHQATTPCAAEVVESDGALLE